MRFPLPMGGGASYGKRSIYDRALDQINRFSGEGGYTDDDASYVRRGFQVARFIFGGVSIAIERMLANLFADTAQPGDLLPDHEAELRVVRDPTASTEDRQAALAKRLSDRQDARGVIIRQKIEDFLGLPRGTVGFRFNTAAALDAAGASRKMMFAFAYEVPLAFITTLGQVQALDEFIKRYKPIHVGAWVTRLVRHGFLTDDPLSLTDRDVLDI